MDEQIHSVLITGAQTPLRYGTEISRTDETGFRLNVPDQVDGIWLVVVGHYYSGGPDSYATARVVGYRPTAARPYSLHTLLWRDNDTQPQWFLMAGRYDFGDLNAARLALVRELATEAIQAAGWAR